MQSYFYPTNLEDQVKKLQIDHNSHGDQLIAVNTTVDKHKTDIQKSTERIEMLEKALAEIQASLKSHVDLQNQLSLTQKQLSDVQKNNEILQKNIIDLKNELSLTQLQLLGVQSMTTCSRLWAVSHDQFKIGREIGRGAWATVHEATFRGAAVAAKCLYNEITSPTTRELFHQEMQMALHCQHRNIVTFLGVTLEGHPVILMELMDVNLRNAYERGNVQYPQVLGILHDIASALHFLHTRPDPVIHRDVSSANVLLKAQYNGEWLAKLGDLGTAKIQQHVTTPGPGALAYAAPEVADPKSHSAKMDVYSFGILVVEILTKTLPFQNLNTLKIQVQQQFPEYHQLITSCTNQQSSDRPTMYDVIEQLDAINTT